MTKEIASLHNSFHSMGLKHPWVTSIVHSNSAKRSSDDGALGGCDPADEDDEGGVANSSPSAGASKYDRSSIGSTLVSGSNCKIYI